MTRYGGASVVNGFRRHRIEVVMIYNRIQNPDPYDGLEDKVDGLTDLLDEVDNCYPELLPVVVNHQYQVTGGPGSSRYIAVIVQCVGA